MEGFYRGAEAQARVTGWLIVATIKLAVSLVRAGWWLLTRHPLVLVFSVLVLFARSWSRNPADQALVFSVIAVLLAWSVFDAVIHRPTRGRRWQRIPAHYLERPDVQDWITGRIKEGHRRAAVAEALRLWAALHGDHIELKRRRRAPCLSRRLHEHTEALR